MYTRSHVSTKASDNLAIDTTLSSSRGGTIRKDAITPSTPLTVPTITFSSRSTDPGRAAHAQPTGLGSTVDVMTASPSAEVAQSNAARHSKRQAGASAQAPDGPGFRVYAPSKPLARPARWRATRATASASFIVAEPVVVVGLGRGEGGGRRCGETTGGGSLERSRVYARVSWEISQDAAERQTELVVWRCCPRRFGWSFDGRGGGSASRGDDAVSY